MTKAYLSFTILPLYLPLFSQSANEILVNLQNAYQSLSNYTDRGSYTTYVPSRITEGEENQNAEVVYRTYDYHVAIDSNQNVFHWIVSVDASATQGWEYQISADQQEGSFKRFFGNPDPLPRSLVNTCASLYAVGGGILDVAAGLMFPYLHDSANAYKAPLFNYDSIQYVQETIFGGDTCQILEFFDSFYQTAEMIRHHEHRRDSILNQYPSPPGFAPPSQQPGLRLSKDRLLIRKADGLIIRMDRLSFKNEEYVITSSVFMNPVVNVEDFARYLKY